MPQQFSDNNIDKAFREKLGGLRVEPRSRVWYRVSAGLDHEAALVAHKKRRVIGVLIGVILLTGIILTAVLDPVATRRKVSNTNGEISKEKIEIRKDIKTTHSTLVTTSLNPGNKIEASFLTYNSGNSGIPNVESNNFESVFQKVELQLENPDKAWKLPGILSELISLNQIIKAPKFENSVLIFKQIVSIDQSIDPIDCNCQDRLYAGANFKFNRTSFADTSLSQNQNFIDKFQIQKAFSVYAGYNITKNISVELGWNIFSNEGQSYGYTSMPRNPGAKPTRHDYEIALRYTQIPLRIKYGVQTWSGVLKTHVTYNLAIGAMYGKLLKSEYSISEMDISSRLKKSEIAGVGNVTVDIKVYKNLSFSSGVEVSYSNNIFEKDKRISPFTTPHNLVIGATAGLKYCFCRK